MNKTSVIIVMTCIAHLTSGFAAESFGPQHDKVQKYFQSGAEKTTKDAIWTAKNIFKVGVLDDNSNRDGYAQYVCEVLNDHGFKGKKVSVQVIDIVKLSKNGAWVKLGEAQCT